MKGSSGKNHTVDSHLTKMYSHRENRCETGHNFGTHIASESTASAPGTAPFDSDSYQDNMMCHSFRDYVPDSVQETVHLYDAHRAKPSMNLTDMSLEFYQLSGRPHCVNPSIRFPRVDVNVLKNQQRIIASNWPTITDDAWRVDPELCELYTDVRSFNLPNFMGARRTLWSGLNLHRWEELLTDYHDSEVCFFLRYGWPMGYHCEDIPTSVPINHPSAEAHPSHIEEFLHKEKQHKAIVGPFKSPPFTPWMRQSPMMTRPKKNTTARRVIIDLSFPEGHSVNDGIDITSIYGRDSTYTLPSIMDLTAYVVQFGKTAWVWKADLARAYRQLRLDPIDTPLLGIGFKDHFYLDVCPSFGCRSSSSACQRVAAAVTYLMRSRGWVALAFLDDFAGVQQSKEQAERAYQDFIDITRDLGLELALDKCASPTQLVDWLGYEVNVNTMTVAIPKEKLRQVLQECERWDKRHKASKVMNQSLVGRLLHIEICYEDIGHSPIHGVRKTRLDNYK